MPVSSLRACLESEENFGARCRAGTPVVEIAPIPLNGCQHMRYSLAALSFERGLSHHMLGVEGSPETWYHDPAESGKVSLDAARVGRYLLALWRDRQRA